MGRKTVSKEGSQVPSALLLRTAPVFMAGPVPASPAVACTQAQVQAEGRLCILGLLPLPQHLTFLTSVPSLPSQ